MTNYDFSGAQKLVGLTVTSIDLSDDRTTLILTGERDGAQATYRLETEGDCCSQTWIEGVYEESALIGHTIAKAEELKLTTAFNGNDHTALGEGFYEDGMAFYGLALSTERGRFVIDYRNSSNGYYGGSIKVTEA